MAKPAFEQFVGDSLPALTRHAYALTGDRHAAEDLVQDTLVRMAGVWRRIDKDGNPLAYARRVMLRIYLSRWRILRRRPVPLPLVETAATGDPFATVDIRDSLRRGLWVDAPGVLAFGGWDRQYWTTTDGGSTWQAASTQRDLGPAGSYGTFGVNDKPVFLASRPPVEVGEKNPIVAATDGSFWVACTDGACAYVTRDHGTSWPTVTVGDGATSIDWLATYDGHTVFSQVRTGTAVRLVHSSDGGATWTDVLPLTTPEAGALALPTGDLLLTPANADGGLYRYESGATDLQKVAGAPAHPGVLYLSGGVIVAAQVWDQREDPNLQSVVSVSADGGATWTTVPAPSA